MSKWFTDLTIIDQGKYNFIIEKKKYLFVQISNSILELQNFYENNSDIVSFTKNTLMNILRNNDGTYSKNKLLMNVKNKISSNENFKIEDILPRNNYTLFNCIIEAMKNIYNIVDVPHYNKSIIEKINNNDGNLVELKELIRKELKERNINEKVIEEWVKYVEI